jgi:hypothetical protein
VENKGIGKVSRRDARSCYRNDALRRSTAPDKDAGKKDEKRKGLKPHSTVWKSTLFDFSIFESSCSQN